jgi:menaquinone-specific isochorismate synthase
MGRQTSAQVPSWFSGGFFPQNDSGFWFPAILVQKVPRAELEELLRQEATNVPQWKWKPRDSARSRFLDASTQVLQEISAGSLTKAVPYAFLDASQPAPSPGDLARMLLHALRFQRENGGYLYGCWNAGEGILGLTPELLFERQGSVVRTMALAGTRTLEKGREAEAEMLLLEDPKERHEHFLVIEGIFQRLAGLGTTTVGKTGVRRAGSLVHLFTPIELTLDAHARETSWQELVDRLHPTPALGAHPREAGARWLMEQEALAPRSRFGAPFGVRLEATETCAVAIRNIEWNREKGFCRIGAGAGVVRGSIPEQEWSEIERKGNAVLKILGLETC